MVCYGIFWSGQLDLCNSLLCSLSDREISKLQCIQNSAARLVTKTKKGDDITPILRNLQWLPVRKRIIFKILLITCKGLNGLALKYLVINSIIINQLGVSVQMLMTICDYIG